MPTHTRPSVHVLCTVICMTPCGVYRQSRIAKCLCSTLHVVWALHITQRTHAIQCHCTSECSMLSDSSSSHVRTSASTTAAWAHLRAPRDTGSPFHGTPDLGEGPSAAHAFTCPWNAKRKRQDYGCMCMCGNTQRVSHVQWRQTGDQTHTGCMQSREPVAHIW